MGDAVQTSSLFRVGIFEIDSRAGELRKNGIKLKLEGKPFQILVILLERPGDVVTREELQEKVWPNTFVDFEHNLNTAIKKIRDAFGDTAENPRFVQTLPRRGYRFIAPVNAPTRANAVRGEIPSINDRSSSRFPIPWNVLFYIGSGIAVTMFAALVLLLNFRRSSGPVERSLRRITFDDGLQFEATWSPDGRFLAYSSDRGGKFDIWVQQLSSGDPVRITHGTGESWQPDWSPDGKYIAYRSEAGDGGLFIIPALGGAGLERKISAFGYYPQWSPTGSQILFRSTAMGTGARLYVVGLDGGSPQEVFSELTSNNWVMSSAWHPDGKRVSMWTWDGTATPFPTFQTARIDRGKVVRTEVSPDLLSSARLAPGDLSGWGDYDFSFSWSPSGDAIYFERTIQRAKNIWKMSIDPGSLRAVGLERVTAGAEPETDLAISRDGRQIAFTGESARVRGWTFPFNSAEGRLEGAGKPVTPPGVEAWQQVLTRDGKKLAFAGKRGGRWEVWITSLLTGHGSPIIADDPYERNFPQWSPDGTRLAYMREKTWTGENQLAIWSEQNRNEVTLFISGHQRGKFPYDWSSDGWLLTSMDNPVTHRAEIWRIPADEPMNAERVEEKILADPTLDAFQSKYSADGRWIVFEGIRNSQSVIYVIPASGGKSVPITDGIHWCDKPLWSVDGRLIYFLAENGGFFNLWGIRFDPRTGKTRGDAFRITSFTNPRLMIPIYIPSVDISLNRNTLALTMEERSGSIWILSK